MPPWPRSERNSYRSQYPTGNWPRSLAASASAASELCDGNNVESAAESSSTVGGVLGSSSFVGGVGGVGGDISLMDPSHRHDSPNRSSAGRTVAIARRQPRAGAHHVDDFAPLAVSLVTRCW